MQLHLLTQRVIKYKSLLVTKLDLRIAAQNLICRFSKIKPYFLFQRRHSDSPCAHKSFNIEP